VPADLLSAKIVGRWRDGTPLALSDMSNGEIAANRRRSNDFLYERDDPDGIGCPHGAHVRRSNPRDSLPGGAERTMRHRIIRRGMPYRENEDAQGLVFVCFAASIENGFEFIQKRWITGGDALGLGPGPDFLLQQPDEHERLTGRMVIPGYRTLVLEPPSQPFVSVRGASTCSCRHDAPANG
jgi:hypothetical protein